MPTALITGATGQDGAYMAQFLLQKGYRVVGLLRRSASADVIGERLRWLAIERDVEMRDGDLTDLSSLMRVVQDVAPDEVYNLAAQSFVATSWQQPLLTGTVTGMGAIGMLEALRLMRPVRDSTRLRHRKCTERRRNLGRVSTRHSIREAPMPPPSCSPIG